jgi:lysyl-tRNA synthetase class 2
VTNIRAQGANLIFYDIKQEGKRLQIMANSKSHSGAESFQTLHDRLRRGDIIGIEGQPGRTKTGELTIQASNVVLLSPCLFMLPT